MNNYLHFHDQMAKFLKINHHSCHTNQQTNKLRIHIHNFFQTNIQIRTLFIKTHLSRYKNHYKPKSKSPNKNTHQIQKKLPPPRKTAHPNFPKREPAKTHRRHKFPPTDIFFRKIFTAKRIADGKPAGRRTRGCFE